RAVPFVVRHPPARASPAGEPDPLRTVLTIGRKRVVAWRTVDWLGKSLTPDRVRAGVSGPRRLPAGSRATNAAVAALIAGKPECRPPSSSRSMHEIIAEHPTARAVRGAFAGREPAAARPFGRRSQS